MDAIDLVPMTREQYEAWLPGMIADYAQEHVATGRWSAEEALERSRKETEKLLPEGLDTPDHHLWSIVRTSDQQHVGILWVQVVKTPTPHAYIFNIEVDEQFRRRGYAMQAMTKLEEVARGLGANSVRLHVFGHNMAARPLYEKLGYIPTNINMMKALS